MQAEVFLDTAYAIALSSPNELTDCVSFTVMQVRGITEALTTDERFQQAGFRALMREGSSP